MIVCTPTVAEFVVATVINPVALTGSSEEVRAVIPALGESLIE